MDSMQCQRNGGCIIMKGLLIHDFKSGLQSRFWIFLIWIVLVTVFTYLMINAASHHETPPVSVGDLMIKWFRGMQVPSMENSNRIYVPKELLCYQLGIVLITVGFLSKELNECHTQVFLRISDRLVWWKSKYIWLMVNLAVFEILFMIVLFMFAKFFGVVTFRISSGLWSAGSYRADGLVWNLELIIPIIVGTFAIGFGILLTELITSTVVALVVGAGWITCSLFWNLPCFVGNSMMYYRNNYFEGSGCSASVTMVVCDVIMCILFYLVGKFYIKRNEIGRGRYVC